MERRNTIQKDLVLKAVREMHRHVTADEIYEYIREQHPSIGKGTVYRNLGVLSEENKIRKVEIPDGPDCFDFRVDKHCHMRCLECGGVFDIDINEPCDSGSFIKDSHGMKLIDYDIFFRGICNECLKKEREEKDG